MYTEEGVAGGAPKETRGPAGGLGGDQENQEGSELLPWVVVSPAVETDRGGVHPIPPRGEYEEEEQVREGGGGEGEDEDKENENEGKDMGEEED